MKDQVAGATATGPTLSRRTGRHDRTCPCSARRSRHRI